MGRPIGRCRPSGAVGTVQARRRRRTATPRTPGRRPGTAPDGCQTCRTYQLGRRLDAAIAHPARRRIDEIQQAVTHLEQRGCCSADPRPGDAGCVCSATSPHCSVSLPECLSGYFSAMPVCSTIPACTTMPACTTRPVCAGLPVCTTMPACATIPVCATMPVCAGFRTPGVSTWPRSRLHTRPARAQCRCFRPEPPTTPNHAISQDAPRRLSI